jgi:peptidyl-prolyl cis-trans isomerase D
MLNIIRKNADSWMVKAVLWMIVFAFVATIFYSWGMGGASGGRGGVVATVDGSNIHYGEYDQSYNNLVDFYREQYKGQFSEDLVKTLDLKTTALDALIQKKLLLSEAEKQNIKVSEQELSERVKSLPVFQKGDKFSPNMYKNFLKYRRQTAKEFEDNQRDVLAIEKMEKLIKSNIKVSESDMLDVYQKENEKIKLSYISIAKDHFKPPAEASDEELQAYFEKNKQNFEIPEQVKVEYVKLAPKFVENEVTIIDEDIQDFYKRNISKYEVKKQFKAHHILFRVAPPTNTEEKVDPVEVEKKAKDKAEEILKKLKEGADFKKMAKEHSDDKVSGNNGGDLGQFSEGVMVREFEEAFEKMKVGELSDLVRTNFGFHIIKLDERKDARTKPISEVKDSIEKELKEIKGRKRIRRIAKHIYKNSEANGDLKSAASEYKVETKTTDFISRTTHSLPDIGIVPEFFNMVFAAADNKVSEPLHLPENSFLIKIVERKPAYIPEFSVVEEDVKSKFTIAKSEKFTKDSLKALEEKLTSEGNLENIAKDIKLEVKETPLFSAADSIPGVGNIASIKKKLFALNKDEGTSGSTRSGHFLFKIIEKEGAGDPTTEKSQEIYARLKREKASIVFKEWLENIRSKAEIMIDKTLL